MLQLSIKVFVTTLVIVAVSEVAKRSSFWAAILASLPLTSLLAFIWLYIETGNTSTIISLSQNIFWLVLASLVLFVVFPLLLRAGWPFWISLVIACVLTAATYFGLVWMLSRTHLHL